MKIIVDLVRVKQEWIPDTDEQRNSMVVRLGGAEIEIPATEAQIRAAITETARAKMAGLPMAEAPQELIEALAEATPDEEFGGDFDTAPVDEPPGIFQDPEMAPGDEAAPETPEPRQAPKSAEQQRRDSIEARRAGDPAQARKDAKTEMRRRAAAVPHRRPQKDDMGYPLPTAPQGPAGPVGHPEVVVTATAPRADGGGDDDGFPQG